MTATEYDNEIYRQNGLNPKSLKVSDVQMQLLEAGYKKTQGNLSNLTLTTAVSSQTSFINACSLAELKASSGAFTPQQAIADAIKQVAQDGAYVIYPSGHRDRLDVAVRRNVMTGIGQTTGQICLSNAQELGCDHGNYRSRRSKTEPRRLAGTDCKPEWSKRLLVLVRYWLRHR